VDLKRVLPIAVIGVAVLALVAYQVLFNQPPTTVPQSNTAQTQQGGASAQMPPQANTAPQFDKPVSSAEPATIVPEGTEIKDYCEQYYIAWKSGDWNKAFELQPLAKQQQKDVNGFAQSLQSYGLVNYEVGEPQVSENVCTVGVKLDLGQNGIWTTNWTFVKNDKGQWTVQDSITGMSQ